ncbi:unnamed protein product [Allacma fusca]|uniref:Uncharacterized protein n=1 Tax=Allacma fusca TaxID=39272 RepID=A0A8J2LD38_9HEXA|nr:unnamed protein product [Allacma fusca]
MSTIVAVIVTIFALTNAGMHPINHHGVNFVRTMDMGHPVRMNYFGAPANAGGPSGMGAGAGPNNAMAPMDFGEGINIRGPRQIFPGTTVLTAPAAALVAYNRAAPLAVQLANFFRQFYAPAFGAVQGGGFRL